MKNELRCNNEETAQSMEYAKPAWAEKLGFEVVVNENVPPGKVQFWRDDEMISEIEVDL